MFLIKSIFLIIVNKKPHFKKVHLLIFQFPSPPTLNIWLFHLLYLYSFFTYLYSSVILFFFFFWCLLVFFFLLFFLPHPPLTRPHEAEEWQPLPILAYFSSCFGRNRPYQPVSVAVSARIGCIGGHFGHIDSRFHRNWPESRQVDVNRRKLNNKKRGGGVDVSDAGRRIGFQYDDLGATSVLSKWLWGRFLEGISFSMIFLSLKTKDFFFLSL